MYDFDVEADGLGLDALLIREEPQGLQVLVDFLDAHLVVGFLHYYSKVFVVVFVVSLRYHMTTGSLRLVVPVLGAVDTK